MAKKTKKKLNVKFLVILVSVLAVAVVAGVIAVPLIQQSPDRAVRRATAAQEEGDWALAASQWDKAARLTDGTPEYVLNAIDATMHLTGGDDGQEKIGGILQSYNAVLASDPGNLRALRGRLSLLEETGRLDAPSADYETREIRRLAGEILKQEPDDAQARTLRAIATLNLAEFAGEGVSAEQAERALADLREVAADAGNPDADGLALVSHTLRLLRQADKDRAAGRPEAALETWQQAVGLVDEVAQKAGPLPETGASLPRVELQRRVGESYRAAARVKPFLDVAMLQAGPGAATLDAEQRRKVLDDPVTRQAADKALANFESAAAALDDEAHALDDGYRRTLLVLAEALQERGRLDEAEAAHRRLVAARPWDATASMSLASFLQQRGRVDDAVATLREQLDRYAAAEKEAEAAKDDETATPGQRTGLPEGLTGYAAATARTSRLFVGALLADLLLTQRQGEADAARQETLLAEARDLFENFDAARRAKGYGESATAARVRGQLQLAAGNEAQALRTLEEALRMTEGARPGNEQIERLRTLSMLADANRRLNQSGALQRNLEEMLRLRPDLDTVRGQLAQVYLGQGQPELAKPLIEALLASDPQNAAYQQLALAAAPADQRDATYDALPEATDQQRRAKMVVAARLGRREEAVRLGRAVVAESPDDATATMMLAEQYRALGQADEAAALLEPLAATEPNARVLLAQLRGGTAEAVAAMPEGTNRLVTEARLAAARGDAAGALSKLEEARESAPDNAGLADSLFAAYVDAGRLDDARAMIGELTRLDADNLAGRSYDVRLLLAGDQTEAALREAGRLAQDFPQVAEAQALQAAALSRAGRPSEAADVYRRALELSPANATLLGGMVGALQTAGRGQEAGPFIETGLRVAPDNAAFRRAQLAYEVQYGDADQAIAERRDAAKEQPDNPEQQLVLAQTLVAAASRPGLEPATRDARVVEALSAFRAGLDRFPGDVRFLQGAVAAAAEAGEDQARALVPAVETALGQGELATNPQAAASAAQLYATAGDFAKAESVIRRALGALDAGSGSSGSDAQAGRGASAGLLVALSEIMLRQGRPDEAVAVLGGYEDVPAIAERKVALLATRAAGSPGDEAAYDALRRATDGPLAQGTLSSASLNALAYTEIRRGNPEAAISLLDKSLEKQPGNARTLFFKGAAQAAKAEPDLNAAQDLLQRSVAANGRDADALRELARVQRLRGEADEAAGTYSRLLGVAPDDVEARLSLLGLLIGSQPPRTAEAARVFREAEEAGVADQPRLLLARARLEEVRGRKREAADFARRAAEVAETDAPGTPLAEQARREFLTTLLRTEQYPEVVAATDEMAATANSSEGGPPWWALRARGEALAKLKRREQAVAAYSESFRAVESAPSVAEAVLVDMAQQVGFEPAYALVKDKLEPADGSPPPLATLLPAAAILARDGQAGRAVDLLRQVEPQVQAAGGQLRPEQRASIALQIGTLSLQAQPKRLDQAEPAFREVLKVAPNNMAAQNNLAYALMLQAGDEPDSKVAAAKRAEAVTLARAAYEQARAAAERAGEPADPNVLDTYASTLLSQATAATAGAGQPDRAALGEVVTLLRGGRATVEDRGTAFPELYLHLSQALLALGQPADAAEAGRAGLALLDQKRQSGQTVDAGVEADLREAVTKAESGSGGGNAEAGE